MTMALAAGRRGCLMMGFHVFVYLFAFAHIMHLLQAGLSYVDDRPNRRIDFWVGLSNLGANRSTYYNSSTEIDVPTELANRPGGGVDISMGC